MIFLLKSMFASKMPSRLGTPRLKVKEINIKEFFSKNIPKSLQSLRFLNNHIVIDPNPLGTAGYECAVSCLNM